MNMRSRAPLFALLFAAVSFALPIVAHAGIPFFGPIIDPKVMDPACALGWGAVMLVINNIISFLITIAIVFVAPIMIAYSGFLFVVNPVNAGGKEKAKSILLHTIVGIVIALAGWLIVDAIMAALYHPTDSSGNSVWGTWSSLITGSGDPCLLKIPSSSGPSSSVQSPAPNIAVAPAPIQTCIDNGADPIVCQCEANGGGWNFTDNACFTESGTSQLSTAPIQNMVTMAIAEGRLNSTIGGYSYEGGIDINTAGYQAIDTETTGLEQVDPALPYSQSNPISPNVEEQVKQTEQKLLGVPQTTPPAEQKPINGVDPSLVKAIIQAESSGNPNATHLDKDGKSSYGLMQVRPDTAKIYDPELRSLSDAQIGEKLKDPDYNVKIGTAYLQDLSTKYNGDLNKTIAAYNGGPGANGQSRDCPGSLRWQCKWDNAAQTVPNTGYTVTRNYVTKVNQYHSNYAKSS